MHFLLRISLCSLTSALCAACVPLPHVTTVTPEISGTVSVDGRAVAGMAVYLGRGTAHNPCEEAIAEAKTDTDGLFQFPRRTDFRLLYAPLVAPVSVVPFTLCVLENGVKHVGYSGIARSYDSQPLSLACELTRDAGSRLSSGERRVCREPQRQR